MEAILSLLKELIRFKTVHSMPSEINRCAEFIEQYLRDCGAKYRRLDHQGVPSISVLPLEGSAPILLMSHIDVVEGEDDLFIPREEGERLYGRGSLDDKYAAALSLVLLGEYLKGLRGNNMGQPDLPFGILITGDEEIGGRLGAMEALREIRADFCIALDGGGLRKIVVKEKGILELRLISRGRTAHGARPWLGENAIEKLIRDYHRLQVFFERSTPDHWHRTMNFSVIHGGKSFNQVPDYAEAVFDIRYTENDDTEALLDSMMKEVESEIRVEAREPLFQGGDSPYLDLLLEIAGETEVGAEHGASDARFLSAHGIAGIVWGADGDQSHHSSDEHVNMESVYTLYRYLETFVNRSAGRTRPG